MSRLIHTLTLLLLVVCASLTILTVRASEESTAAGVEEVELTPFAAYEYLQGDWEVYRHLISYSTGAIDFEHSLPVVRWQLAKENNTANLFGRAFVNGSAEEHEGGLTLHVEFHDPATGKFQVGVDEDNLSTLFHFGFHQVRGSVPVSVGRWNGAEVASDNEAAYVFQASSPDRFTILVTPRKLNLAAASKQPTQAKKPVTDDEDEVGSQGPASTGHPILTPAELAESDSYIYVGHRIKAEPEKTFFQRYGTMVLLGGMLLLNVWMRTKQSASQTQQRLAALNTGAAPRLSPTAGGRGKSSARIEEITEGEISVGDVKKDK